MVSSARSSFANWGDFLTGYILFAFSQYANFEGFLILTFYSIICGVLIFSFRLFLSSLSFYASDMERLGYNIFMAFLTFMSQPSSIFTGLYKVFILTFIPAGFISIFSVVLVKEFIVANFSIYSALAVLLPCFWVYS